MNTLGPTEQRFALGDRRQSHQSVSCVGHWDNVPDSTPSLAGEFVERRKANEDRRQQTLASLVEQL